MKLYECIKLKAKISLAACEDNRNKPEYHIDPDKTVMPSACKNCTDFLSWGQEALPVSIEPKQPAALKICQACGNDASTDKKFAKGMCVNCYQKAARYRRKEQNQALPIQTVSTSLPTALSAKALQTVIPKACVSPKQIYLACPYSHPDATVRQQRFVLASKTAGELIRQGHVVFSPISMGHSINEHCPGLPYDFEFWQKQCLSYLKHWATHLYIVQIEGFDTSLGVAAELEFAKGQGLAIINVLPLAI